MKEDFYILKEEFKRIKNMGLISPLRRGSTGIGYTFETLLNKKEDTDCKPDFKGIELKTKLGYSKSPLTLFHCVPQRKNDSAIHYIFQKYSYTKSKQKNIKIFECNIFSKKYTKKYNHHFIIKIDYLKKQVIMESYYNNVYIEDVCYWDFKILETKLKSKLNKLAIIYAYPYKKDNKLYYKYLKMNSYKLKGFFEFLRLIEEDKISIQIYLKQKFDETGNEFIDNHGIAFRIDNSFIEELFTKLYV